MLPSEIGNKQKEEKLSLNYIFGRKIRILYLKKEKHLKLDEKMKENAIKKIKKSIRNHGSGIQIREILKFARTTNYNKQQKL